MPGTDVGRDTVRALSVVRHHTGRLIESVVIGDATVDDWRRLSAEYAEMAQAMAVTAGTLEMEQASRQVDHA